MSSPGTIYLVDASPYIFRAFFSLPSSMVDPAGHPVGAVYGFAGFLLRLIDERAPSHLGVAFDGSLTTSFRNEIYPPYKAQRDLPPAELEAQLDACREMAAALGATTWIDERYEADDLIATACRQLAGAGPPIVVVTSDKDLAQLVGGRVSLLDFARETAYRPAEVREKFGVAPGQIPDLLGLAGDSVDNIPGVRGVGQKTAVALLSELGDLETLYERLDEVADLPLRGARSVQRKLAEGRAEALLSKRLATVADDAPIEVSLAGIELLGADRDAVGPLFERLGFSRLEERIGRWREAAT
jgi:5'-3' exonuclease